MVSATIDVQRDVRDDAFSRFVEPELEVLLRVARRFTGSLPDAEDLVQETLVRAYGALDRFDGQYPRAWLITIMRNAHLSSLRRRRPELVDDLDALAGQAWNGNTATSSDPEEAVMSTMLDDRVARALQALPPSFRRVVELVDVDGLRYQDAAAVLGIPKGTVMSRLHRARTRMRRQLERSGFLRQEAAE